ncbi:MAG: hypothetical protein JRN15_12750 [Nitrososphaerota archaeon]|nr:hypothetical protein [Nitrososphaerota archaeon]
MSSRFCNGNTRALGQLGHQLGFLHQRYTGLLLYSYNALTIASLSKVFIFGISEKALLFAAAQYFKVNLAQASSSSASRLWTRSVCFLEFNRSLLSQICSKLLRPLSCAVSSGTSTLVIQAFWSLDTNPASFTDRLAKIQMNSCSITDD